MPCGRSSIFFLLASLQKEKFDFLQQNKLCYCGWFYRNESQKLPGGYRAGPVWGAELHKAGQWAKALTAPTETLWVDPYGAMRIQNHRALWTFFCQISFYLLLWMTHKPPQDNILDQNNFVYFIPPQGQEYWLRSTFSCSTFPLVVSSNLSWKDGHLFRNLTSGQCVCEKHPSLFSTSVNRIVYE